MSRTLVLAALALVVLAGCVTPSDVKTASLGPAALGELGGRIVASDATGALMSLDPAWVGAKLSLHPSGFRGGEPSLGVTSDGAIFIASGGKNIARSVDHGKTWKDVTPPPTDLLVGPKTSLDPWVWVDPKTDRVFDAPLYVVCTWMAYSDNKGDSWRANPLAGCGTPAHDHQKLTTGPPVAGVKTNGYPDVIYYSYNSFRREGTFISASYDGGKSFTNEFLAHKQSCHAGIAGPVIVSDTGTAYSPKPTCDGIEMAVSHDSGKTWQVTGNVDDAGQQAALAAMTDVAVDAAGHAYAVWTGKDGATYMTRSLDDGASWSKPYRISPVTLNSTTYPAITAGADGRLVVAYLGTKADTKGWATKSAENADEKAVWHGILTFVDGAVGEPRMTTIQVTPDDDPVQIGCIWQSGGSNSCRNLGDFIDVTQVAGRPYFVFADGCKQCKTAADSRGSEVTVAMLDEGPSLMGGVLAALG